MTEKQSNWWEDAIDYNEVTGVDENGVATGTTDADWINSGAGNDTIYGGTGGRDMLAGNSGNDTIYAGALGEDGTVTYNESKVEIYGGEGNDKIYSGAGNDYLSGDGSDVLKEGYVAIFDENGFKGYSNDNGETLVETAEYLDGGNDEIYGGDGNDYLFGGSYLDSYKNITGSGDDTLVGGKGNDKLWGGDGKDTFVFAKGDGNDIIYDASSDDTIKFEDVNFSDLHFVRDGKNLYIEVLREYNEETHEWERTDSVMVKNYFNEDGTVAEGMVDKIVAGGKTYSIAKNGEILLAADLEEMVSNVSDEFIYFNEKIDGTAGDDPITASAGKNSWVNGGAGADTIKGVSGYNMLAGNEGDDTIIGGTGFNEIYGGEGKDTITGGKGGNYIWGDGVRYDVVSNGMVPIEGDDDTITGGAGDDEIYGGSYLDVINGSGSGDDVINGGAGNDTIWGGDGDDTLTGGKGADSFNFTIGQGLVTDFGNDIITDASKDDKIVFNSRELSLFTNKQSWVVTDPDELEFTAVGDDLVISTESGTVTLENFMKNKSSNNLDTITFDEYAGLEGAAEAFSILNDAVINVSATDGVYKGTDYNESITTSAGKETFTMGKGHNTINVVKVNTAEEGQDAVYTVGEKIVNLTSGEDLSISIDSDYEYSLDGKDLVITLEDNLGTVRIKNAASMSSANVNVNGYDIYDLPVLSYDANTDLTNGKFKGTSLSEYVDADDYVSKDGVKGVTVDTGAGNDEILGSAFNDTIKSMSGNNFVNEWGGKNKVTTGKGNDVVLMWGNSSTTAKLGAGDNCAYVGYDNNGTNKITTGAGDDAIVLLGGSNTVKAGNGDNIVAVNWGENKVTTGKGDDKFYLGGGSNNIKSGNGDDTFEIGEYNNIDLSRYSDDPYYNTVGVDYNGAANIINAGNGENKIHVYDIRSRNKITTGKGVDTFTLNAGTNNVSAGAGEDVFTVTGGYNVLDGGKGNDIYNVDSLMKANNVIITDTKGSNTLNLGETLGKVNIFFDVEVGKKGKAVYSDVIFSTNDEIGDITSFDNLFGVTVSSKKGVSTLTYHYDDDNNAETPDAKVNAAISSKNLDALASQVASWLKTNNYASTADVFAKNVEGDVTALLTMYTDFANNDYQVPVAG